METKNASVSSKPIFRSGIIPYYVAEDGTIFMMFMKPSKPEHGGPDFQIAKGRRDPGETDEQTALREGQEELGLFAGNVRRVDDLGTFLGRTKFYIAEINSLDPEMWGLPHFETGETTWYTPEEFYNKGRTLHVPVVKAAVRRIKTLNNRG